MAYKPNSQASVILGSIPSLLTHPNAIPISHSFQGTRQLCKLPGRQLYFDSKLEVDTDGSKIGKQDKHGRQDTTVTDASGKFLDANEINFFVLPEGGFDTRHGIRLGDVAVVVNGSRKAFGCYGDRGHSYNLGEGSIALHRELGNETVVGGKFFDNGIDEGVVTIVFPGSGNGAGMKSGISSRESAAIGEPLFQKLRNEAYTFEMELLSRFRTRQIAIPAKQTDLELKLLAWMQEVVDKTPRSPDSGGLPPARYLVTTADGIATLLYAPVSMALPVGRGDSVRTVYADFKIGRTPTVRWYVQHVTFHLSPQDQAKAEKAESED